MYGHLNAALYGMHLGEILHGFANAATGNFAPSHIDIANERHVALCGDMNETRMVTGVNVGLFYQRRSFLSRMYRNISIG